MFPPTLVKEDEALPETADCRMVLWRHEFGIERVSGSGVGRRPRAVVLRWRHDRMSGLVEILGRRHDRGDRVLQHSVASVKQPTSHHLLAPEVGRESRSEQLSNFCEVGRECRSELLSNFC